MSIRFFLWEGDVYGVWRGGGVLTRVFVFVFFSCMFSFLYYTVFYRYGSVV